MNQRSSISDLNKIPHRMVVHTQDAVNMTGLNERTCRALLRKIRIALGKRKNAFIIDIEFATYCQIDVEEVRKYLRY